jgi:hypothetical protein
MGPRANVTSVDSLKEAKIALLEFRAEAGAALVEAEADLQKTLLWLRHDQLAHWQKQVRVRTELVTRARSDLYRKQVAQEQQVRAGVDQKKALEAAKRRLEEAEEKIQSVKRWIRVLDRELVLYKGECQGLASLLEGDLPQGAGRIDRMMEGLAGYLAVAAPSGGEGAREGPEAGALEGAAGSVQSVEGAPSDGDERGARDAPGRDEEIRAEMGPNSGRLE